MKIHNYTGHDCNFDGIMLKSNGSIRLPNMTEVVGEIEGVKITRTVYNNTILPEKMDDIVYLVPLVVAQKNPDRSDFYIPSSKDREGNFHSISKNPFSI